MPWAPAPPVLPVDRHPHRCPRQGVPDAEPVDQDSGRLPEESPDDPADEQDRDRREQVREPRDRLVRRLLNAAGNECHLFHLERTLVSSDLKYDDLSGHGPSRRPRTGRGMPVAK